MTPLDHKTAFGYFRLGLVTGLLDKRALVEWADAQIMSSPAPTPEIIELSLSESRPYSEIIWLLSHFEGEPSCELALKLLLAHAGILLESDPDRAPDLIMGLRLLNEEEYLSKEVKIQLTDLECHLKRHAQASLSFQALVGRLAEFLDKYTAYRPQFGQLA